MVGLEPPLECLSSPMAFLCIFSTLLAYDDVVQRERANDDIDLALELIRLIS